MMPVYYRLTIPSEVLPHRWRSLGQGCANIAAGIGVIMGFLVCKPRLPLFMNRCEEGLFAAAGAFLQYNQSHDSWRYTFYIELGLWILATLATLGVYWPKPLPYQLERTLSEKIKACDPIGTVIWACFTIPLLTGLNYGDNPYAWSDAHAVAPIVVGCVFLLLFIVYEVKINKQGRHSHCPFVERGMIVCFPNRHLASPALPARYVSRLSAT